MNEVKEQNNTVSIKTFGCQMNMYDSEVAQGLLKGQGYELADENRLDSDVVIMNTCSVREHAEDRVYGRLGMLRKEKEKNPNMVIGLMGCMVEEHQKKLFKRFPHLDMMVGTRNIKELPKLIDEVRQNRQQVAKIRQEGISIEYTDQIQRKGKYHAWLPIMTGCNKVCTFCIVPITRGSEVSMRARDVYREATRLVEDGVNWITLLGQNVNSYRGEEPEAMNEIHFPELLDQLCEIDGLEGISFTTSHPQDATKELYEVIARNPKISRRFHLPLQSGSSRILKRMKRLHTYEEYLEKIQRMRAMIPDVSITTDIIAGFSGETQEDHELTVKALKEIRYDGAYIYKYSVRPGTPAAKLPDDVPLEEKSRRNALLLELQKRICHENHEAIVGSVHRVFVESVSPKNDQECIGRSLTEKKVSFPCSKDLIGTFQTVKFESLHNETFRGNIQE